MAGWSGLVQRAYVLPPLNAVLELAGFVLVIYSLDLLVPGFDLARMEPNPCWLPVLLLSVQYGTSSGLLAAAIAVAVSAVLGFPEQDIGENLFVYLLRVWGQPMLWITAALLLGQFRTRHILERSELTAALAKAHADRARLAGYADNLRARLDALERHMAGRGPGPSAQAVLAALAAARTAGPEQLDAAFRDCIDVAFPGAAATLLAVRRDRLVALATAGPAPVLQEEVGTSDPFAKALIAGQQPLSVLTSEGERALAGRCLAAAPVPGPERAAGIVMLHTLDPRLLTPELPQLLGVVAAALAGALGAPADARATPEPGRSGAEAPAAKPSAPPRRLWQPRTKGTQARSARETAGPDVPSDRRAR